MPRSIFLSSSDPTEPAGRREIWLAPRGELRLGSLAVRVLGQGPPALLLHGFMGSNRYWGAAFDRLADQSLLLAPDLLGFGASPRPASGYGPEDHGRALVRTLEELDVRERVLVAGHSTGALLGLWLASQHPDKVSRVVAFAPPLFRDPEHAKRQVRQLGTVERLFAFQDRPAEMVCTNLCEKRPKLAARVYSIFTRGFPYPILEDATRHSWSSYSQTIKRVILAAEAMRWLASARCEVELVAGTEDKLLDLDLLRELADRYPHVRLRILPGAGHHLPLTDPERCLAAITGEPNTAGIRDGFPSESRRHRRPPHPRRPHRSKRHSALATENQQDHRPTETGVPS